MLHNLEVQIPLVRQLNYISSTILSQVIEFYMWTGFSLKTPSSEVIKLPFDHFLLVAQGSNDGFFL